MMERPAKRPFAPIFVRHDATLGGAGSNPLFMAFQERRWRLGVLRGNDFISVINAGNVPMAAAAVLLFLVGRHIPSLLPVLFVGFTIGVIVYYNKSRVVFRDASLPKYLHLVFGRHLRVVPAEDVCHLPVTGREVAEAMVCEYRQKNLLMLFATPLLCFGLTYGAAASLLRFRAEGTGPFFTLFTASFFALAVALAIHSYWRVSHMYTVFAENLLRQHAGHAASYKWFWISCGDAVVYYVVALALLLPLIPFRLAVRVGNNVTELFGLGASGWTTHLPLTHVAPLGMAIIAAVLVPLAIALGRVERRRVTKVIEEMIARGDEYWAGIIRQLHERVGEPAAASQPRE